VSYIESNLLADERVVYKGKLHWVIFLKPAMVILLGCIFLPIQPIVGLIVLAIGCIVGLPALIDYLSSEFGVTDKRVVIKVGFVRRRTLELLLRHVEAISVDQSVAGRIFGFGSLTLTGTGGVKEMFNNVTAPLEFRRRIQDEAT